MSLMSGLCAQSLVPSSSDARWLNERYLLLLSANLRGRFSGPAMSVDTTMSCESQVTPVLVKGGFLTTKLQCKNITLAFSTDVG